MYFPGRYTVREARRGAEGAGVPRAQPHACYTCGVKLVQLVVNKGCIPGTGAGICLQATVSLQATRPACQPATHPEALQ